MEVFYDASEKGADFILKFSDGSKMVIEVGFNKEDTYQVKNTIKKIGANYGIVIGSQKLELVEDKILKVPLKYWLLI